MWSDDRSEDVNSFWMKCSSGMRGMEMSVLMAKIQWGDESSNPKPKCRESTNNSLNNDCISFENCRQ